MKRLDAKIWLLLVLAVPLCGNTCTFHSTSNNGSLYLAVCTPPSSAACLDPGTRPPPDDDETGSDTDTTGVGENSRTPSQPTSMIARGLRSARSLDSARPLPLAVDLSGSELQFTGLGVASPSEPVPALGPVATAFLVAIVVFTAFWKLRTATASL